MGPFELVLWVPSALLAMGVAAWLLVRRDREAPATERAPFPRWPALAAVLWVVACPLPAVLVATLGPDLLLPDEGTFATVDPGKDAAVATFTTVGLAVGAWVSPALAFLGWLVISTKRSVPWALGIAALVALGGGAGLLAGLALPLPTPPPPLAGGPEVTLLLTDAIRARASGMLCLAAAGAMSAVAAVAASSKAGLRGALTASLLVPCFALTLGALATPPDVISQLLAAIPIVGTWAVALGVGAAVRVVG